MAYTIRGAFPTIMKADSLEHLVMKTESDGFRYHLSADCPHASDGRIADLVTGRMQPDVWFKQTRRRHIMSYGGLLIKLYIFHGFSDVRHSRRYVQPLRVPALR